MGKWFTSVLGNCYKIELKDGRIYIYKDGENDIMKDLEGVDISDSIVTDIPCTEVNKLGWQ